MTATLVAGRQRALKPVHSLDGDVFVFPVVFLEETLVGEKGANAHKRRCGFWDCLCNAGSVAQANHSGRFAPPQSVHRRCKGSCLMALPVWKRSSHFLTNPKAAFVRVTKSSNLQEEGRGT